MGKAADGAGAVLSLGNSRKMHVSRGNLIYIKKRSHVRLELLQTSSPICGAAIAHRGREGIKDHIRNTDLTPHQDGKVSVHPVQDQPITAFKMIKTCRQGRFFSGYFQISGSRQGGLPARDLKRMPERLEMT